MSNNFETYQEFNESSADLINKFNLNTVSMNNNGFDNKIVNPELNIVFLNDKSYVIPDSSPSTARFSISGWAHSNSIYNTNKCVRLSNIITETFSTYTDLKNNRLYNLNLKSDMHLYTLANIRIENNSVYVFAIEYDIVSGSTNDKDLALNSVKHYNTNTSSYDTISFNTTGTNFTISEIKTLLNNNNHYIKYYYVKSNNYFEHNAQFRFEISATTTNNTAKVRVYNTNFYKGDMLFNGLSNKKDNMIKSIDNAMSISENGFDYIPISTPNRVTVGSRNAKYTDILTAINSEPSGTTFELISNINSTTGITIYKSSIIVIGNNYTITFSSTLNLTTSGAYFKNVKFNFNNNSTGMALTNINNVFENCYFYNATNIGISLTNSNYNKFINCSANSLVTNAITLNNSKYNEFRFNNIDNFYNSGVTTSKCFVLTNNSDFNIIETKYHKNTVYDDILEQNVVVGPVDSIVSITNSDYNKINVENFNVFVESEDPYAVFKFYDSGNNNLVTNNINSESTYTYVYTNESGVNYLNSYTPIDVTKASTFPQLVYSDGVNTALNGVISKSTGVNISASFGTISLLAGANTFNVTTTNLNSTIIGSTNFTSTEHITLTSIMSDIVLTSTSIIVINSPIYTRFSTGTFEGSQKIDIYNNSDTSSYIKVFGYQSTPDGLGRYTSNHANENLVITGENSVDKLKTLEIKAENITNSGFTKLGSDAPAIKKKYFTGTISSVAPPTYHGHGLNILKIISSTIMIIYDYEAIFPNDENDALFYRYRIDPSNIQIRPGSGASSLVNSTYHAVIEYIE